MINIQIRRLNSLLAQLFFKQLNLPLGIPTIRGNWYNEAYSSTTAY